MTFEETVLAALPGHEFVYIDVTPEEYDSVTSHRWYVDVDGKRCVAADVEQPALAAKRYVSP